ncbi:tetratricopeptide repeat protein [Paludibaculum fermentans]|uniref:tetratricopeptide repeat protein n=1 Tax=Paludibaculum fermentans TaxID=1473598 RepID=UPI003EBB3299
MTVRRLVSLALLLCLASMAQTSQPAIEQIQSLIDNGEYRQALDAASRLVAQSPRASEAFRLRANARRNLNDLAGALQDADKAVELDPLNPRALGGRAIVKRLLKDTLGALADVGRAVTVQPAYHQGYDSRALMRQETGDLAGALGDANRAIELSPRTPAYLVRRANIRRAMKNAAGASADYSRAIEINPDEQTALSQRASLRSETGDLAGALDDLNRTVQLSPANGSYLLRRGELLRRLKDPAGAERDLTKAIEIDPNLPQPYFQRALVRLEQKRWNDSISDNTRAIDLKLPNNAAAYNNRGLGYKNSGLLAEARRDFEQALQLQPGDKAAAANIARLGALPAVAPPELAPAAEPPDAPPSPPQVAAARRTPAAPITPLPKVAPPARIEFANLPDSQYESAVSAGMEGMKLVLTPTSEEENAQIERLWAPAFQFPCAEVVDYLNRLNPLLAGFLAYRSLASYAQAEFSRANTDALEMAALGDDAAVESAMAEAQAQAQRLSELAAALDKAGSAIRALGDPPDAEALMGRARRRAVQAYQYGRAAPEGDLEYLHRTNFFRFTCNGSVRFVDTKGNVEFVDVPIPQRALFGFPVQWDGDEFFYSGPTFLFDQKNRSDSNLSAGAHLLVGKVSPDGDRVLSLRFVSRSDDGREFAIEMRDIDLRNRQQSFNPYTSFLSNYSLTSQYATAAQIFKTTVRMLDRDPKTIQILEYRPFGFSISLFKDPDVPSSFGSKETLAAVRKRLDGFWARPAGWAKVTALSEEKLNALFHRGSAVPTATAPPKPVVKTKAQEDEEDKKARMEALQKDIEYIQADLAHLRNLKAGDPQYIQFLLDAKESEVLSKRDLIASLQTGEYVHTRTPFDDRTREQMIAHCEKEVYQMASMDHERRTAEALKAKLEPAQREAIYKQQRALLQSGSAADPAKWREITINAYTKYQNRLAGAKEAAENEVAVWDNRIFYAEMVKTGADTAFSLLAGGGGYKVTEFVYFLGAGGLESGLGKYYQTGSKAAALKRGLWDGGISAVTRINDTVHYAYTAGEAFLANDKATPSERMSSVAASLATKYGAAKIMGLATKGAVSFLGQLKGRPPWKPGSAEAIAAMKYRQQMEMDQALVKDFVATDRLYRRALATRAAAPELAKLRLEVERKVFSVNSSYGAKLIMKHQTLPADQRNYVNILREVHDELTPQLVKNLRAGRISGGKTVGRYDGDIRFEPIRNASSGNSPGVDYDLALIEPGRMRIGAGGKPVPNVWVTCDGVPTSANALRTDAQQIFNRLYRQRTGHSATVSLGNVTNSTHPEAYADRAWLGVRDGRFATQPNPAWAQQAADVTRYKASEMQHDRKLLLGYYDGMREACRGTGKDIQTKLQTVLKTVEGQQGSKWTADQKRKHAEVTGFWSEVETVLRGFGQGKIDPLEAERRIHLLSGGRGLKDLVDRAGATMEGYAKALPRP